MLISSSEGGLLPDRKRTIVTIGQTKHSTPSNNVDHAQIRPMVRPRQSRKLPAAARTKRAPQLASASHASHAPMATTRLPSVA